MFFPDAFAAVAACYREPEAGLGGRIKELCASDPMHEGLSHSDIEELQSLFETSDINELRRDYARLFVGPFELVAPPFGSVYLEGRRTLMGASTQDVLAVYQQAGLDMAKDFNNPPDHVVAELEFLAYLHSVLRAADPELRQNLEQLRQQFLQQHLGAWIEPFTSKLEQGAETGFYRLLAPVTRSLVLAEIRAAT